MRVGYWSVSFLARTFFRLFYRAKVYGLSHTHVRGAVIAPNHTSFYDPPMVGGFFPHEVHFLASDYLFNVFVLGPIIRWLNSHPIHRGAADLGSIKKICELLMEGKRVVIFPEGRRIADGRISHLKPGIGLIVLKSRAKVIPTYIHGTFDVWSSKRKWPRPFGKVAIVFGSAIDSKEFAHLEKKEAQLALTAKLESSLRALQAWYLAGAVGTPP